MKIGLSGVGKTTISKDVQRIQEMGDRHCQEYQKFHEEISKACKIADIGALTKVVEQMQARSEVFLKEIDAETAKIKQDRKKPL